MRLAQLLVAVIALFAVACAGDNPPLTCSNNDDCFEFYRCDVNNTKKCLRECTSNDDCLAGQYCDIPNNVCRDGQPGAGGDPVGGDPVAGDPAAGD